MSWKDFVNGSITGALIVLLAIFCFIIGFMSGTPNTDDDMEKTPEEVHIKAVNGMHSSMHLGKVPHSHPIPRMTSPKGRSM